MVTTTTPGGQHVSIGTCTWMGHHLAKFTRRPRSSLYTLATEPTQVAASVQVSASGQVATPCSCRLLSHQTLRWHHHLDHPSLPHLRGMHSRLLVSGLPRSLPPLPPLPALPCLPCVNGRHRAAPHSSSSPPTTAPLQTLHMDVWGPACVSGQGRERYFLLVVDDYTRYTTVFPLRRKIRGGEFSSDFLRDFCCREGILQSFMLLDFPQQNGIVERHIGLVMEVARTSMIHAAAPHFLWPFAFRYAAHQLNLWPRVSLPQTSPTLRFDGEGWRCVGVSGLGFFFTTPPRAVSSPLRTSRLTNPIPGTAPVEVDVGLGAARGAAFGGAEPGGAESEGAGSGGVEPGDAEPACVEPGAHPPSEMETLQLETLELEELELLALEVEALAREALELEELELLTLEVLGVPSSTGLPPPSWMLLHVAALRVLVHVAAQRDYELHSLDFRTSFLHDSLHEEIWLRRPPGFTGSFPTGTQWSLWRPVYGLGQAPRKWHDTLRTTLAALGFAPSTADPSLFLRTDTSLPLFYVLMYVDNLVFATADTEALTLVKSELQKRHTCSDLGPLALRLLVPLSTAHSSAYRSLALSSTFGRVHRAECPELVGCLITSGMGLVLGWGPVVLTGHADACWVDDSARQRSSQGYTFSLGSGSVSWRSTRSSSVLSSNCEAEIYAGAMAAQELCWLTYLLTDLGEQPCAPVLYQCSQLRLAYVATRASIADVFTKALPPGDHQCFYALAFLLCFS
ncbi:unnamed protein product [Closterium sp. NIES-53]